MSACDCEGNRPPAPDLQNPDPKADLPIRSCKGFASHAEALQTSAQDLQQTK
eukprot:gene11361-17773_t